MTGVSLSAAAGSWGDNASSQPPTWSTCLKVCGCTWVESSGCLNCTVTGNGVVLLSVKPLGSWWKLGHWWHLGGEDKQEEQPGRLHQGWLFRCFLIFKPSSGVRQVEVMLETQVGEGSLSICFCPFSFFLGRAASSRGPKMSSYLQISHNCTWSAQLLRFSSWLPSFLWFAKLVWDDDTSSLARCRISMQWWMLEELWALEVLIWLATVLLSLLIEDSSDRESTPHRPHEMFCLKGWTVIPFFAS